jgi:hypothetical protein
MLIGKAAPDDLQAYRKTIAGKADGQGHRVRQLAALNEPISIRPVQPTVCSVADDGLQLGYNRSEADRTKTYIGL